MRFKQSLHPLPFLWCLHCKDDSVNTRDLVVFVKPPRDLRISYEVIASL
jgi:hypothetical protein